MMDTSPAWRLASALPMLPVSSMMKATSSGPQGMGGRVGLFVTVGVFVGGVPVTVAVAVSVDVGVDVHARPLISTHGVGVFVGAQGAGTQAVAVGVFVGV